MPELAEIGTLSRTATLTRGAQSGTAEIALSSEFEVEREDWFGERWIEVLDHSTGAIDLSRAKRGVPLLFDHDKRQVIGRIEKVRLDQDRVLRAAVRFSASVRGKEAAQDFTDDILTEVSVGYRIIELEKTTVRNGVPVYRAVKWELMEGSLVAVPADPSVGKGRSATDGHRVVVHEPRERRMETDGDGKNLAKLAKRFKMEDRLGTWIERELTPDQALEEVNRVMGERADAQARVPVVVTDLGIPARERAKYSTLNAIRAAVSDDWKEAGFERAVSEAISKETNRPVPANAFLMPTGWGTRAAGQLDTATSTQGQELVFIEPGSFIELLRNKSKLLLLGAKQLPGLVGNVAFPRETGAMTFVWTGEAPTADVTASNMTFDQLSMSPKTGMSMTVISKRLLVQSPSANVGLETQIRSDIAAIHALAIDAAGINGTGTNNQPLGILATANSVSVIALGTNGLAPTYDNTVDLFRDLAIANSIVQNAALLTTPGIAAKLMKTQKFATTNGEAVWVGTFDDGRLLGQNGGYRAAASNQVPSNLTKGTATTICHAIIAGNYQELLIGHWGAMEVLVDPYTLGGRNLIRLISTEMLDIGLRHKDSFKIIKDALST